ncbi:MAG: hypothetical protein ABSF52_06600 [Syntrophobacteraceae bacterium]|jgi:hypothetical protein
MFYITLAFLGGIFIGFAIRPVYWIFTGKDIPLEKSEQAKQ